MTAFDQALALARIDGSDDSFRWQVPAGWEQGRGAWGGLVVGAAVKAVRDAQDARAQGEDARGEDAQGEHERTVRTVSVHMMGPVPAGSAIIDVVPARIGSSMSTWSATVRDESGSALAEAMVISGRARADDLVHLATAGLATAPTAPSWHDCPVIPIQPPLGPAFAAHLEFRPIVGIPMSAGSATVLGWIRLPDQGAWSDIEALSLADAYWPSMYPTLPGPRPMATVSFSAHLLADPKCLAPAEPLLYEASLTTAHEGFTTETRRLWSADGRLVVENLQSIVVIR